MKWFDNSFYNPDELTHHGIKGQKWGVRRYQNKDGSRTAAGKKQDKYTRTVRKAKSKGSAKTEDLEKYNVGLTTMRVTGWNGEQKEWVSGLTDYRDASQREESKIWFEDDATDWVNAADLHDYVKHDVPEGRRVSNEFIKNVNPGYGESGTTQNCAKVSTTVELELHGYSFTAGRQSFPSTSDAAEYWWKGAQAVEYDNDTCEDSLRGYGPGTSGTIGIRYPGSNTGHAMHWTNDTDGNFSIEDGQNGKVFSSLKEMTSAYGADTTAGYLTYRLDNCEPNWDHLGQDGVVRLMEDNSDPNKERASRIHDTIEGNSMNGDKHWFR